jgi:hypothetical protein
VVVLLVLGVGVWRLAKRPLARAGRK